MLDIRHRARRAHMAQPPCFIDKGGPERLNKPSTWGQPLAALPEVGLALGHLCGLTACSLNNR